MSVQRALVVDDSKVARSVLAGMLEKHGVAVDTTESAEEALEYLLTHQPDVIFLDHVMPGMDGFQAMRAIKQNPQTATIPIMMYTSKEGEVYVGQARALGAVGCLPKQVQPADVAEVLERLGRMHVQVDPEFARAAVNDSHAGVDSDADGSRNEALRSRVEDAVRPAETEAMQLALRKYMEEQQAIMRHEIAIGCEEAARTVVRELAGEQGRMPSLAFMRGLPKFGAGGFVLLGALFLLPMLVLFKLYSDADGAREQLQYQVRELVDRQAGLQAAVQRDRADQDSLGMRYQQLLEYSDRSRSETAQQRTRLLDMITWAFNENSELPYGQNLLDSASMDSIRGLLEQLNAAGVTGTLQITRHQGRFCLVASPTQGLIQAPADMPIGECSIMQATALSGSTDALVFEQMLNNELTQRGSGLRIQVADAGTEQPRSVYPYPGAVQTAGDWNRIAQRNNWLEISINADEVARKPPLHVVAR